MPIRPARALALLIVFLLIAAAPAAAEESTDVVVTSSLCCLTADGAGPDTLTYSVMNPGDATITGFEVQITVPPGTVGEPAIEVWVIDELAAGASTDLTIALSPDTQVLGTTIVAPTAVRTSVMPSAEPIMPAGLPAWLRIV